MVEVWENLELRVKSHFENMEKKRDALIALF